jgi:hypothetical protein
MGLQGASYVCMQLAAACKRQTERGADEGTRAAFKSPAGRTLRQLAPTSSQAGVPESDSKPALTCKSGEPGCVASAMAQHDASASTAAVDASSCGAKGVGSWGEGA